MPRTREYAGAFVLWDEFYRETLDGHPRQHIEVAPGQVDWDEPSDLIHRAVDVIDGPYEEITISFLAHPDVRRPDAP